MTGQSKIVPRIVIRSIAFGILLMALFTAMWLGIASAFQSGFLYWACNGVALLILLWFVVYAIKLLRQSNRFPALREEDKPEGQRIQKGYAIVFGLEGTLIGVTCALLGISGHGDLIIPSIALIVGLHFYPMARVFNRRFDYIPATWTTAVGLTGLILAIRKGVPQSTLFLLTGLGVALATFSYGIYMISQAERYKRHTQ